MDLGREIGQTTSFGYVIESKATFQNLDHMIGLADERMYINKQNLKRDDVEHDFKRGDT
jgi:hypothetical protein